MEQDVNSTAEMRQEAIDWLNGKRDTEKGLEILEKSGYKPHVSAIFRKNVTRKDIPGKVLLEIRNYLRYFATPTSEVHKDELTEDEISDQLNERALSNIEKELANEEYPQIIKQLLTEFHGLYQQRSILHKGLKEVGEGNDLKSTTERKRILFVTDAISRRMDALWQAMEAYKADGTLPSEELFATSFDPDKVVVPEDDKKEPEKPKSELVLATDVDGLKKQSENWRTKLSKAQNRLDYQDEKKANKPNPMPEGPKRITLIKRIDQLKAEKETIDLALANMK